MTDQESNAEQVQPNQGEPVLDFDEQFARDPQGASLFNWAERVGFVFGALSSLLTLAWLDLEVTLGWTAGWLVFQGNVFLMRWLFRKLIMAKKPRPVVMSLVAVLKMFVILTLIWVMLKTLPINVLSFFGGFTVTMTGLVVASMVRPHRKNKGGLESGLLTLP